MYNKAILIGRLTAEPELKYTQSGTAVVSFRIAVDRPYKGQDGQRQADFIGIQAWRQTAELVCRHFHKGDPILVEGAIQTRSYEDNYGQKRTVTEVVADRIGFLPGKPKRKEPTAPEESYDSDPSRAAGPRAYGFGRLPDAPPAGASPPDDFQEVDDGDLPF